MAWTSSLPPLCSEEQREDVWNLVIKVKYGDALKRFSAYVHQNYMIIEYDMNKLRSKISHLFNFSPDSVLLLTYTDEDGDTVVLDNDDELCDAVIIQKLNPLRITVQIKSHSSGGSYSGQSAAAISDCNSVNASDKAIAALNSTVENSLKSVPEPMRGALLNIFHEVIQAASSVPIFSELLLLSSKSPGLRNPNVDDKPEVADDRHNQSPTVCPVHGNIRKMDEAGQSEQCLGFINYAPVIFDQNIMSRGRKEGCDVRRNRESMAAAKLPSLSSITQGSNNGSESFDKPNPTIDSMFLLGNSSTNGSTHQVDASGNKSSSSPIVFPAHSPLPQPYERSPSFFDGMGHAFHGGIICDGCGMHPFLEPIYKSNLFENVLCSTCFHFNEGVRDQHKLHSSQLGAALASHNRMKDATPKLDSCFVRDVTVWDGTVMSPCSRFTKIWKMRNNGTISWPFGTQLVRVRGDYLGGLDAANLKIPETGFPVGEELDIAVNFFSPSALGQYTSFWRMVSPFGCEFGEEIRVIIQVDDHQSAPASLSRSSFPKGDRRSDRVVVDVSYPAVDAPSLINPPCDVLAEEDLVERSLLRELDDMGFKQIDLNREILKQNQYDLEQSLEDLCGFF